MYIIVLYSILLFHTVSKKPLPRRGKRTGVLKKFIKKTPRSMTLMSFIGQLSKKQ
jgi:hypothetical protein